MAPVVVSTQEATPLAVVYGAGGLAEKVAQKLHAERLRVVHLRDDSKVLPIWEEPAYTFFFVREQDNLADLERSWANLGGKKTLILVGCQNPGGVFTGYPDMVRVIGGERSDDDWLEKAVGQIVRFAFTKGGQAEIMGKSGGKSGGVKHKMQSWKEIERSLGPKKPAKKQSFWGWAILAGLLLVLAPFLWLGYNTVAGVSDVLGAVEKLRQNDKEASWQADRATGHFAAAKGVLGVTGGLFAGRYYDFVAAGERAAGLVGRAGRLSGKTQALFSAMISNEKRPDLAAEINDIALELGPVDTDLGFIEAQYNQLVTPRVVNLLGFLGIARSRIEAAGQELTTARKAVSQMRQILGVLEEIVPLKSGQSRTYLVVLQNSAELRPTGGFIGSYALVSFQDGKFSGYKIYDIYSADGQLRGHVTPPDEILHFLGQPNWYMRDANWAADFPLSAKRLEWFLEKETGVKVNGVVGLSLPAVQKMLAVTGPLMLADRREQVSAENFFEKAEFASEINFFAGSTQKPQFLAAVAGAILGRISQAQDLDWVAFGRQLQRALAEKDVMVYFDSTAAEKVVRDNGWGGSIVTSGCDKPDGNCLALVEANLGANKANFFVKRGLRADFLIDKAGGVETTVVLKYRNESPSSSWPGGDYKNYLRVLLPMGAKLTSFDLGEGKEATVSTTLTADVIKAVLPNQFLVFESAEQGVGRDDKVRAVMQSFGTFFTVGVKSEKTVKFKYKLAYKLDFNQGQQDFNFTILRQPGTGADRVDLALDYPSFLGPIWNEENKITGVSLLALPQKLVYNMELSQDREIRVRFRRQ